MKIDIHKRTFVLLIPALDHYIEHLRNDEEDPGPSGDDAMYLRYVRDELMKTYVGEDGKIKPEFLP